MNLIIRGALPTDEKNQEQLAEISAHVLDSFQGVATIQGFVAERVFEGQFLEKNNRWRMTFMNLAILRALFSPHCICWGGALLAIIWIGAPLAAEGTELTVGDLAALLHLWPLWFHTCDRLVGCYPSGSEVKRLWSESLRSLRPTQTCLRGEPVIHKGGRGPAFSLQNLHFAYPDDPDHLACTQRHY